jgi:crotonobetainyl-CoA:carnitine CoA-transferase CaiB-like acyl-CoA transferase
MLSENNSDNRMQQPALAGVKVLDFGWALVGSLTGKHLADNGAKVIRVESATRIDLTGWSRFQVIIIRTISPGILISTLQNIV